MELLGPNHLVVVTTLSSSPSLETKRAKFQTFVGQNRKPLLHGRPAKGISGKALTSVGGLEVQVLLRLWCVEGTNPQKVKIQLDILRITGIIKITKQ